MAEEKAARMTNKTTSAIDLVERLDLPEAFEAWWQPCRHKNREPITDYNRKKQLAFDAFQAGVHAARTEAADTITRLKAALEKCRDTFRDYERQHEAKAQKIFDDGKTQGLLNAERMAMNARLIKAKANADMADMCDEALSSLGGQHGPAEAEPDKLDP